MYLLIIIETTDCSTKYLMLVVRSNEQVKYRMISYTNFALSFAFWKNKISAVS